MSDPKQPSRDQGDLLGSLISGLGGSSAGGSELENALGSLLGESRPGGGHGGENFVNDLMTALNGGQPPAQGSALQVNNAGPLGELLNSILGSQQGAEGVNSLIQSIIDQVSRKAGVQPAVVRQVVTFAMAILAGQKRGNSKFDPQDMMNRLQSGQGVTTSYLNSTGLAQQLASQAGMDPKTAAQSLQHVLSLFGQQAR